MNDYMSRLKEEFKDLSLKIEKLNNFIERDETYKTIDPKEQELLKEQREVMTKYASILRKRIK